MIKHIVMWRIDKVPADSLEKTIVDLKKLLLELGGKVQSVRRAEVGFQEGLPPVMALYMEFSDWKGLEVYRDHPEHLAAITELRKHTTKLAAVDYEAEKSGRKRRFRPRKRRKQ